MLHELGTEDTYFLREEKQQIMHACMHCDDFKKKGAADMVGSLFIEEGERHHHMALDHKAVTSLVDGSLLLAWETHLVPHKSSCGAGNRMCCLQSTIQFQKMMMKKGHEKEKQENEISISSI